MEAPPHARCLTEHPAGLGQDRNGQVAVQGSGITEIHVQILCCLLVIYSEILGPRFWGLGLEMSFRLATGIPVFDQCAIQLMRKETIESSFIS